SRLVLDNAQMPCAFCTMPTMVPVAVLAVVSDTAPKLQPAPPPVVLPPPVVPTPPPDGPTPPPDGEPTPPPEKPSPPPEKPKPPPEPASSCGGVSGPHAV